MNTMPESSVDTSSVGILDSTNLVGSRLLPLLSKKNSLVVSFLRNGPKLIEEVSVSWLAPGTKINRWVCLAPICVLPDYFDWLVVCGIKQIMVRASTSRAFTKADSSDPAEQVLAQSFADGKAQLIFWAENHGITWTVLRPTLIYGLSRDENFNQIAHLIRRFGFSPLLGEACGLRQPIHLLLVLMVGKRLGLCDFQHVQAELRGGWAA